MKLKKYRERNFRRQCLELAIKSTNNEWDAITNAIIFEHYIKNGAGDLKSMTQVESDVKRRDLFL